VVLGNVSNGQDTADNPTEHREDRLVEAAPGALDDAAGCGISTVDDRLDLVFVRAHDGGDDLFTAICTQLPTRLAGDVVGVVKNLLLGVPQLIGLTLESLEFFLALA
jgi:hypothetical protein